MNSPSRHVATSTVARVFPASLVFNENQVVANAVLGVAIYLAPESNPAVA